MMLLSEASAVTTYNDLLHYFQQTMRYYRRITRIPRGYANSTHFSDRVARLAFFRPNFKNLASFLVGWPQKFVWPFGSFLAFFR